ncbi:MAG: glyceraldehyde dehydrogenase subunit alpha [Dehalococcoidia bacterium]
MQVPKLIGARIKRREDPRLITGHATYVDDVQLPGMLYMAVLRSLYAHARIRRIDTSKAAALPGVVAVFTGEEVRRMSAPLPCASAIPDLRVPERYALAVDKVRFAGEGVAAVVATDRYVVRDALDLIEVEYEPLPAVVDPEKAMEAGAPILHDQVGDNIAYRWNLGGGEVDEALRSADLVIRQRMENQRLIPNPMETRGVVARYVPGDDRLTFWASTQIPHLLRTQLGLALNLPENKVRVIAPEVGGGFGCKLNVYAEEVLAAAASVRLGKPVKWIEDRRENFVATTHGRAHVGYIEAGVKRDGTLTGLRVRIVADLGAYQQLLTPSIPTLTALMQTGCYKIPVAATEIVGVFTNKTPVDAYRGAGRPEATHYVERLMDLVARELNMDPVEVRRRNFIQPNQFPYTTAAGLVYDSGNYDLTLNRALEMLGYQQFRQEQERLRREGRYIGVGFSTYVELCGVGPSAITSAAFNVGGWESATVRVQPTGKATVLTGASPHGQGEETTFAQMVADELGVPIEDVTVIHGDTDVVQYGIGTFGSRGLVVGGSAVHLSLQKVKEKAVRIAAHVMEAQAQDVVYQEGRIYIKGFPERAMTIQEVANLAYRGANMPPDTEPGLEATSFFDPPNFTFPFGTHICTAEVDINTGEVKVLRYIAVDDCGRAINPLLVEGQIQGGIAQGVGQALLEGAMYDENGQLITGSLMDYPVPTAIEMPMIEMDRTETPTPVNPLGAKGVGEAGTIAASPAVVNAVVDALAPLDIKHIDMPMWPSRVWQAIQQARG